MANILPRFLSWIGLATLSLIGLAALSLVGLAALSWIGLAALSLVGLTAGGPRARLDDRRAPPARIAASRRHCGRQGPASGVNLR
ncbi:MAG: hypothetical protein EA405_09205 [Rhodospirillales bacterium]|nr:MAG: hypothetical protein EA405_09205 [Rhodospirillales bacterium]